MPDYIVKTRELRWAGESLPAGSRFSTATERETKQADLLVRVGKIEPAPEAAPVRKVASTVAPAPAPGATPTPPKALDTNKAPKRTYKTRRLKAEK